MQTGDDGTMLVSAEEATGYHNDSYGDDYEVPMQGPFTERHVGGNRHRHIDLNEGSDTGGNRPEAWYLLSTVPAQPLNRQTFSPRDSPHAPTTAEIRQPSALLTSKISNTEQVPWYSCDGQL